MATSLPPTKTVQGCESHTSTLCSSLESPRVTFQKTFHTYGRSFPAMRFTKCHFVSNFTSKSANQFVMCNMKNSTITQSYKLCSPIKASIDVCLVRVSRGLRVELHVPRDLDRLLELIGNCCGSAEANLAPTTHFIYRCCSLQSDVPRVPFIDVSQQLRLRSPAGDTG